ncbi:beta-glucosidase [Leptolyngbya sp. FACHB-541]|uniref:glycoside hydrolase family 3 N-terminal domain-containing protein n=1 Tax=Leptolyngbya sp. FACHB-541 TaxID=2692810 RepID=UPI00168A02FE|nr:beta-glucosidase [Leptolyngbya sp. FACHB-541]
MSTLPDWETLSLPEWVAQMVVVRASGHLFDHQIRYPAWESPAATLRHWLEDLAVGGVILLGGSAAEVGLRSHQLQEWAKIPLLIAADIEEGVGQRFAGATWFPPPFALAAIAQQDLAKAEQYAEQMGAFTAEEALAIGINWVLAPVVDVNNNPQNPVINVRAFGEMPDVVSRLSTAFIRGAKQHPVLTAAKHFPGHGDTATDSHLDLPVLPHSQKRLAEVELPPFERAIAAGVDAVMSAHLQIPALDEKYPATLSYRILTEELRQRLSFGGLIVTDALIMGAIANGYGANEAPVLAVEAGADILLMPIDPAGAIQAICEAVESGRIAPERIQASVERIWQAKQKVCAPDLQGSTSHAWEQVSPPPVQLERLAQPEAIASVAQILQDSMQVHHPANARLRSTQTGELRNLILVDDALERDFLGKHTPAIALPQSRGYRTEIVDCYTPPPMLDRSTPPCPTLLQLFIRGNPFRGSAGQTQTAQDWFQFLVKTDQLQALVVYGSPYILEQFVSVLPPDVSYVFTYGQMPSAQGIALQQYFDGETL